MHQFPDPTRELEIEMNYVQCCYSFSSMMVIIRSLPTGRVAGEISAR